MSCRVLAVANQKGGVGKTTTSINLAASLAATKRRVLLVDLDAQGNATMGSGVDKNALDSCIYDLLLGEASFADVIQQSPEAGYDVLPANNSLISLEVKLYQEEGRERRLRDALANQLDNYDFIIIDCPPALNLLTVNAFIAAQGILIPMQCEYYALEGLAGLVETIEELAASLNPALEIDGILRTMYDPRNKLTQEVSEQLFKHFGDRVFRTVIPRNIRLAEAPSYGLPALYYDKRSQGTAAYLALAGEILRREERVTEEQANTLEEEVEV